MTYGIREQFGNFKEKKKEKQPQLQQQCRERRRGIFGFDWDAIWSPFLRDLAQRDTLIKLYTFIGSFILFFNIW